jgi:hypothetical protein
MTATNKRLLIFESHDDSNRCTPCRGNPDQHNTYASHVSPRTPGVRLLWTVPIRGNLSRGVNRVGQSHCSREKGLPTQSTARRLTDPWVHTQFLSWAHQWSSGESQTSINSRLLGLPGPYHRHVIGTFNTCSRALPSLQFNFSYRSFPRFEREFELKFKKVSRSWNQRKNHWKSLELWISLKFG